MRETIDNVTTEALLEDVERLNEVSYELNRKLQLERNRDREFEIVKNKTVLKLEVGKTYRTRDGEDIYTITEYDNDIYPFCDEASALSWTTYGIFFVGSEDPLDLVEEVRLQQPTTLKDLVGEDGQKTLWLIAPNRSVQSTTIHITEDGEVRFNNTPVKELIRLGMRWSNSPFTKYENANEFVS